MHVLYLVILRDRIKDKNPPYFYSGSKSNCIIENGILKDGRGKEYWGSSNWKNWKSIVNECKNKSIIILKEFDNYTECLESERNFQLLHDVVANIKFFNKSIAMVNNYTDPSYATYKHLLTGKIVRLPRNHNKVLIGEYVGITKGCSLSEEHKQKIRVSEIGEKNPFFGKHHSEETKNRLSLVNAGKDNRSKEQIQNWIENIAKRPKSLEHRKKIGRKGFIIIQNIHTMEVKRIQKENYGIMYDKNLWLNPIKLKSILRKAKNNEG